MRSTLFRRTGLLFVCALVMLMPLSVALFAQLRTTPGEFQTHAYGLGSCGKWTEARRETGLLDEVFQSWVYGFVTGAGDMFAATTKRTLRTTDTAAIRVYVDNYCETHPLDTVAKAAETLVLELAK